METTSRNFYHPGTMWAALMRVTYVIHFETITLNYPLSDTHTISRGAFVKYHVVGRVRWILEYQIVEHGSF